MKSPFAVGAVAAVLLGVACSEPGSLVDPVILADGDVASSGGVMASDVPAALAVPFKGRFAGTQTVTPLAFPLASVAASVTGNASLLGAFTMELPHIVNFVERTADGIATLVAANGDVIIARFAGQAQVGPVVSIVEQATIIGGTGRFAGAAGSFRIERLFNPALGTTSGSFEGTISASGATTGW